jgi:hypothetical protein
MLGVIRGARGIEEHTLRRAFLVWMVLREDGIWGEAYGTVSG